MNIRDFFGSFGDFETFAHDADLGKYVFEIYGDGSGDGYKMIVGWTQLPYDILLHIIDVEDAEAPASGFDPVEHARKNGVEMVFLKDFIGKYGASIHPDFQIDSSSTF